MVYAKHNLIIIHTGPFHMGYQRRGHVQDVLFLWQSMLAGIRFLISDQRHYSTEERRNQRFQSVCAMKDNM